MFLRPIIIVFTLLLSATASAQFGISVFNNWNDTHWGQGNAFNPEVSPVYPGTTRELAVNYWFRLPTKRIEFQPTVYASGYFDGNELAEYGFQFKTNFYLFDFGGDCNCPTFGKQGPQLQKGFFVQLTPGVARHQSEYKSIGHDETTTVFTVGGGIGIDFGLSNLLTITPIASARYTLGTYHDIIPDGSSNGFIQGNEARLFTYQLGLQATIRLDKRRY